jgi:hypothetical protein
MVSGAGIDTHAAERVMPPVSAHKDLPQKLLRKTLFNCRYPSVNKQILLLSQSQPILQFYSTIKRQMPVHSILPSLVL